MPRIPRQHGITREGVAPFVHAALLLCVPGTLLVSMLAALRSACGADVARVLPMALGACLTIALLLVAALVGAGVGHVPPIPPDR